jgi:hydrogenase nickel incorporation protein HypA/HybF
VHEASLMTNLMRRLGDVARAEGATRIVGVSVWLGALSHFSAAHFEEHFIEAARGTLAEGAALDITLSDDVDDARAADVVLLDVDVEVAS